MAPRVVVAVLLLVLDLPAGRAAEVAAYVAAALLVIVLGTMSLWMIALKKQLRMSRAAEAAARAALRTSEEKFDKAFRSSSECIALSNFAGGEILEVNDQFEQLTGYSRAEVLGRTLADLGFIDGPSVGAWMEQLGRERVIRDHQVRIHRKNGDPVTIVMSAEMIEIGGMQRFLSVSRDISDRTSAEEALQRIEAKYRELVENANDIVFTVDRQGYCLSMNRAGKAIRGYADDGLRKTHLTQLVLPEQAEFVHRQFQRVLDGEDVPVMQIDVTTRNGARITLDVAVRPSWEGGSIVAAQAIGHDVTVQQELEQQLRQGKKMDLVGRLAGGVAHDFNNLLTVILASCEIAEPLLDSQNRLHRTINDIRSAAERAALLTGQLLAFSRRQIIRPQVLDLEVVVAESFSMLTRLIGDDIEVCLSLEGELWHVTADSGQLQQVIINLAVNARDAMPRGGRLTIEARNVSHDAPYVESGARVPAGDFVLLNVIDTGVGIDIATRERLFEPFFTTKGLGKGTGLGLATAYGIVKQNDGFIFADSVPGAGTTFRVLLPRAFGPLEPVRQELLPAQATTGHEKVLLVEDEREVRELLREYLEALGYEVLSAANGYDGMELCRTRGEAPAVLITDIVMPGMSGRALADLLRTSFPELRVLYMSGYTDDALVRRGTLPAGTHFLQKPLQLHALAMKIREMVDSPVS
jgi:two-component system, cell cycle sensor histidine kinase and response regulator CckA